MAQLESQVVYTPHADATPEAELDTLAAVYRFILFDCHAKQKKAAEPDSCNDAAILRNTEGGESCRATTR